MIKSSGPFHRTLRCILSATLLWVMAGAAQGQEAVSPAMGFDSAAPYPEFRPPPLERFSAMVDRPLFSKNRRPATIMNSSLFASLRNKAVTKTTKTNFYLSGVIYNGGAYVALIKKTQQGETHRLTKGQKIEGWLVEDIKPEQVWLSSGNNLSVVSLRDNRLSEVEKRKLQKTAMVRKKIEQRRKLMLEARRKLARRILLRQKMEKKPEN